MAEEQVYGVMPAHLPMRRGRTRSGDPSASERSEREEQLKRELANALAIVRDVNTANQELRDANQELRQEYEALQVREEEAQASTEEVKTLNEELQATNEELETLNEELEATLEELRATNDDLQARTRELEELVSERHEQSQVSEHERVRWAVILASMSDALLVIDAAGNTALTNDAYETLFGTASSLEDPHEHMLPSEVTLHMRAQEGIAFTMQFALRAKDGTQHQFEAQGYPIHIEGNLFEVVVTIRNRSDGSLQEA